MDILRHQQEIIRNQGLLAKKPILQKIYRDFYVEIAKHVSNLPDKKIVELGSGIGNIKEIIPNCLRTDLFPNPWLDQTENAYRLSFDDETVSDLILFDVFHHLRYPGTALKEFERVLRPNGRVIIFDPYISLLGRIVYGFFHSEPIAWRNKIVWNASENWNAEQIDYYAAQGNVTRIFFGNKFQTLLQNWSVISRSRLSAFSYVASGGYSGPQIYPNCLYPLAHSFDKVFDFLPAVFATRALVVLKKK
ncbi:MAG: methyltransferase type 11 [Candidatus Magasanikbacteria bacterium CG10_big_fil_rev_8_21_14_0_10_36_32]|uniref:Methyltransferase type 11 n=1 Tax=Candidatus Magasanikbacteria bacterium CG10_big_fil_rev_8_21_14_0_10_36_32 TaxID=1974646 RepID=A0A2M6W708_9BACT|nr:MAG: methyltransferase type 11 [Candidatus Magasanikbacteria bacterium CG10_big_fil_rev_8_21_14_0_10_36_32]